MKVEFCLIYFIAFTGWVGGKVTFVASCECLGLKSHGGKNVEGDTMKKSTLLMSTVVFGTLA